MAGNSLILNPSLTDQEGHSKFLDRLFTAGVALNWNANSLQVTQRGAGANRSVDVQVGDALLDRPSLDYGFWGYQNAISNVSISTADPSNPRIDAIVCWVNTAITTTATPNSPGSLIFQAIAGTPAGTPSAPSNSAIQTALGSTVAWTRLANVAVGINATTITNTNITDTRLGIGARISQVVDANANPLINFTSTGSAVNQVTVANSATGNAPTISATGSDTNVGLAFSTKGTGQFTGLVDKLFNPYKFQAYLSTASYTLAAGTWTRVPVNTKNWDTGSNLDVATNVGRFTATVAGFYRFDGHVETTVLGTTVRIITALYKNGTEYCFGNDNTASSNYIGSNVSEEIQLAAGDYVEFYANASVTQGLDNGVNRTRFSGYMVSYA